MKSLTKNLIRITIVLITCLSIFLYSPIKAYAWEAHLNEDGDIEIYTVDKKKTTNIWYYSDGVSLTRCQYDPATKAIHSSGEYFLDDLNNATETLTNGTYYNTWTISIDEVISGAASVDGAWAEEIRNAIDGTGPAVYIKLDCIMFTVNENNGVVKGPYVNVPGGFGGNGELETGIDSAGTQIRNAYPWGNPNGLRTHYNHYLLIGKGEDIDPIILDDELVTYDYTMDHYAGIDANQPAYAMSNYSSQFDLSQGIPSSEYIDNAFLADSWYGNTNVYARTVSHPFTHRITYIWEENNRYWGQYDSNDNGEIDEDDDWDWIDDWDTHSDNYEIPIGSAYVAFQFLADTHIYDFTNADVANGAYDGDHVYYDDTNEVPMTCISTIDYKDVGTSVGTLMREEPDWNANTDEHVEFGHINYTTARYLGRYESGGPHIAEEILKDRDAIRAQISNSTHTRNDKLTIDGHTFMKNDWVTGCNFFESEPGTYKACTKSSGWVNDYCLHSGVRPLHEYDPADVTGNVSVQIPPTVDNGYYYTSMKVYYQRLITYSKTASEFSAAE